MGKVVPTLGGAPPVLLVIASQCQALGPQVKAARRNIWIPGPPRQGHWPPAVPKLAVIHSVFLEVEDRQGLMWG